MRVHPCARRYSDAESCLNSNDGGAVSFTVVTLADEATEVSQVSLVRDRLLPECVPPKVRIVAVGTLEQ